MKRQHCKTKLHNLAQEQINIMRNGRDGFRTKRERIPIPKKYQTLGRRWQNKRKNTLAGLAPNEWPSFLLHFHI